MIKTNTPDPMAEAKKDKNFKRYQHETITVTVDIHADGDVYVKNKKGTFCYVGCLGESSFGKVPDDFYLKAKKLSK